jgi:hypothetical protein
MTRTLIAILLALFAVPAAAQTKTPPPKTPPPTKPAPVQTRAQPEPIRVRGFATFGSMSFQASDSFDAVLGSSGGPIFGGGAQVLLPYGLYVEVSVSRFSADGERVFIGPAPDLEVFQLGIPLEVKVTPLDFTAGWRYRHCPRTAKPRVGGCRPPVIPYVGGGFSSYKYQETSDFADEDEDVDERYNGFHVVGGAEYAVRRWLAVGGEVSWSSIADALGEGGVAAAFDESNLGGTTFRVKISIGR